MTSFQTIRQLSMVNTSILNIFFYYGQQLQKVLDLEHILKDKVNS